MKTLLQRLVFALTGACVLALAGYASAASLAAAPVSACAQAATPAASGSGHCKTTTTRTTTTTTTTTATTTSSTTAATTTSTTTSSPTYASETAYTQTRPAFTVKRTVSVSTASGLKSAIANLQPGDYVKASAPFTVSSSTSDGLIIANRLSAPAVIDLTGVKIVYTGTAALSTVWVRNVLNVRIYGGDLSMSQPTVGGGACIAWTASQHSTWWGFDAHDCGSGGMTIFTASPGSSYAGPVEYDDIEGTIHHFSLNHGLFDPHTEKCTGLHGANLADGNHYAFDYNRIALNVYDSACTGGGIEFGSAYNPSTSPAGPIPTQNTIILQCDSLTFISTIQTGGNCYQTWGYGETYTDIRYLHATNLAGHPYRAGGMYSSATTANALSTDKVEYGRAANVRLNPRYASDPDWDPKAGTAFQDVLPLR